MLFGVPFWGEFWLGASVTKSDHSGRFSLSPDFLQRERKFGLIGPVDTIELRTITTGPEIRKQAP